MALKLNANDKTCGTCEYWTCNTRKVTCGKVECSPLGLRCANRAVMATRKADVPGCKFWTKASFIK